MLNRLDVGFEVFTAANVKHTVSWDVMSCSSVEISPSFRRTFSGQKRKLNNKWEKIRKQAEVAL
jgi:hypothetical protein